ncbi:hypothetical protein GC194_01385 [bacterium]|nr:hypothetical protein [bacterium]
MKNFKAINKPIPILWLLALKALLLRSKFIVQSITGTFGSGAIDMDVSCVPGAPCGGGFNKMSVHFDISSSGSFTTLCCTP